MTRDFFDCLLGKANSYVFAPGTGEAMAIGDNWKSRTNTALERAKKACDYEAAQAYAFAGEEWQKIFGTYIPKVP